MMGKTQGLHLGVADIKAIYLWQRIDQAQYTLMPSYRHKRQGNPTRHKCSVSAFRKKLQYFFSIYTILYFLLIFIYSLSMSLKLQQSDFVYLRDVDPSIIESPRYATKHNFTGRPMRGYHSQSVVVSKALGQALSKVQKTLDAQGYTLVVYDAYRPHKAVEGYLQWMKEEQMDTQQLYFPLINAKEDLLTEDYLSSQCPHQRGGSADVSIIKKGKALIPPEDMQVKTVKLENSQRTIAFLDDGTEFMGTHFDFFDVSSHWDTNLISEQAQKNREFLLKTMNECGFRYFQREWWHFYMKLEPHPETYFDFDIL